MSAIQRTILLTTAFVTTTAAYANAQECLGISAGTKAYVSYGAEGTDGVTGEALTIGLRVRDFNLQLHGRRMDPGGTSFNDGGVDGRMHTLQLQVAHPITKKLPLCVFGGLGWTGYELERTTNSGPYTQLRVPLGISLGKEFSLTEKLGISTFVQNAALFEYERFATDQRVSKQKTVGIGMTAGLGLSYGPLMLRSTITNYKTLNNSIGPYNNFPYMSLQLGVKF